MIPNQKKLKLMHAHALIREAAQAKANGFEQTARRLYRRAREELL
jgi:hypothetical protein